MTPTYDQRSNIYPGTSYIGSNRSPYQPNCAYDQGTYGYPTMSHVQTNISPHLQTVTPNYGYGYGSRNNNPSQIGSNYQLNNAYPGPNYSSYPSPHQQTTTPTRGYGYATPSHSNNFYDPINYGYPTQASLPNSGYVPRNYGHLSESNLESSHTYDQRNYGHTSESRHQTNSPTQPQLVSEIHQNY